MIRQILIMTAVAGLTIATMYAGSPYPAWIIKQAHKHGYTDDQIQFCAGCAHGLGQLGQLVR